LLKGNNALLQFFAVWTVFTAHEIKDNTSWRKCLVSQKFVIVPCRFGV
jgi:hypothetical protein